MADLPMSGRGPSPDGGGLDRLLETESALSARLAQAQTNGARLLEESRAAGVALEARYQADLDGATAAAVLRIAAERDATIARIRSEAAARAARFRSVPGSRIDRLAAGVAGRVLPAAGEAL